MKIIGVILLCLVLATFVSALPTPDANRQGGGKFAGHHVKDAGKHRSQGFKNHGNRGGNNGNQNHGGNNGNQGNRGNQNNRGNHGNQGHQNTKNQGHQKIQNHG